MSAHPSQAEIRSFVEGLGDGLVRDQVRHLMECDECLSRLRDPWAKGLNDPPGNQALAFDRTFEEGGSHPPMPEPYDRAVSAGRLEWEESVPLLDELFGHPEGRRRILVKNSKRFHSMALVQRVLDRSRNAGGEDWRKAEGLAQLAIDILEALDLSFYGERLIRDVLARGWSLIADARRIGGDFDRAEEALASGEVHLAGTFDPLEEAGFLRKRAALRLDQQRYRESEELLLEAQRLYEQTQDEASITECLVALGILYIERGDPIDAVAPLRRALAMVDPLGDPGTAFASRHNLAFCLAKLRLFPEARKLVDDCRDDYAKIDDPEFQQRARELDQTITEGLGRVADPEQSDPTGPT